MQASLTRGIYIQVAVAIEVDPDFMKYWPKFEYIGWGVGPNKSRATNKH